MILTKLTRIPGADTPKDVLLGDPLLDEFIKKMDQQLLGSAKVRLQTSAEIKDHLLEKKDYFLNSGCTEKEAAEKAAKAMGSATELAQSQRQGLKEKFIKVALISGILFGLLTAFFVSFVPDFHDKNIFLIGLIGLAQGVLFGLSFSWAMTFVMPTKQVPSATKAEGDRVHCGEFAVRFTKGLRFLSYFYTIVFAVLASYYILIGIARNYEPLFSASNSLPWWLLLILGSMCIFNFFVLKITSRKYIVNDDGIFIEEFLSAKKSFAWKDLRRVGNLGEIHNWARGSWKTVKYAEFENGNNQRTCMYVYPDMVNADRLFLQLEKRVQS